MNFRKLAIYTLLASLSACAATTQEVNQAKPSKKTHAVAQKPPVVLERMDSGFLYLSAEQALADGQPVLAVRFLKALVKKEPQDITPRFELADLLLSFGKKKQAKEAQAYMEGIPKDVLNGLAGDELADYQLLYSRALIANGEAEQAALILRALLVDQPERVEVRLLLARLYAMNKNYAHAHQVLQDGLNVKKDLRLQQMKVQLYLQQGNFRAADEGLAAMQRDYPEHEDIVLQRAHLAEKQGQGVKAEALLQLFIDLHPETAVQSYSMLAGIYLRQNRLDAAIIIYERMLPLTASDASVLMSLGKIYYQKQKFKIASEYFEQAVAQLNAKQVNEELATASFYYGASLEASHQWEKAIPQYEKLSAKHDLYLDAQLRLASIEINQEAFKDAEKRLLQLKKAFQHELGVYEVLSGLRLQQKEYKRLISETDKASDLGYSQPLLFNRAIAFEKLKAYEQLDQALDAILAEQPLDAETLNFYGYSLADRGVRLKDAQVMVEKALQRKPKDGYYLDSLAWVFFKQKQYAKALKVQLDAVHAIQNDAVMMEHLGDIYWKKNQAEQARQSWRKALDLEHDEPAKIKQKIERGLM